MVNVPSYRPRSAKFDTVPKTTSSPNQSNKAADPRYCRFTRNHSGFAQGINYTKGNNEHFTMSWTGTGQWTYDNGEWECRMNNGGTMSGYGGMQTLINGNKIDSCGGSTSTRSTGSSSHTAGQGTGVGGGGQAASGKPDGNSKHSADKNAAQVYPGSMAMVVAETCGMAAGRMNIKAKGNFACGSTDGSGSFTAKANMAMGSQEGTCQIGGKGVTIATRGGGASFDTQGGHLSLGSNQEVRVAGSKIYFNSSSATPETPTQIAQATGKAGETGSSTSSATS